MRGNRTGIVFNDEMTDFAAPTNRTTWPPFNRNNFVAPGKRPLSSMVPSIVLERVAGEERPRVRLMAGTAGGQRILTTTAALLVRTLLLGEPLNTALASARIHHPLLPTVLNVEPTFNKVRSPLQTRITSKLS